MLSLFTVIFWIPFCVSSKISSGQAGIGDVVPGACKDTREGHYRRLPMVMEAGSTSLWSWRQALPSGQAWFDPG